METGRIKNLPEGKPYGFATLDRSGQTCFFHSSDFRGDWAALRPGQVVHLELEHQSDGRLRGRQVALGSRAKRIADGAYEGSDLGLSTEQRHQALVEISRWKREAKLDDVKRYFFAVPELNDIVTGDASYVIGRKGTGKTALVQFLSESENSHFLATKLTFKNFPFNELYSQDNKRYTRPNQYITIWKLIIYSAVCKLIARSAKTDAQIRKIIERAFPTPDSDNLGTIIGRWIAGDFGINILGSGLNVAGWFREKRAIGIQEKVDNLEQFVGKNITDDTFIVLFDELDEDYRNMYENYNQSEYLDLLTSLFKAVQDVRAVITSKGHKLFPVVFLRDDIYDLIQDADKNKWGDLEVNLRWRDEEINGLLIHRLAKVFDVDADHDIDRLWYSIFEKKWVRYSDGKKEIPSLKFISMSTQGRPRDYITYLQECASIELKKSGAEISNETIREADKTYSNYLRRELIDEIHGIIPDVPKVLDIFSERRKWILSIDEFREAYGERVGASLITIPDPDMVLRTLFYFSVIGNVARAGVHIFRHARPDAEFNFKERIVVHRGLMKALQIV